MLRFLLYLIILILAIWLGIHLQKDPGYILLAYGHWSIEMPLWLGVILIIVIFFLIYWLLRFLNFGCSLSGKLRLWSNRQHLRSAQYRTKKGLIDLAEGHWRQAEKNLIKGAEKNDAPLINYLSAAKAAQEQGSYERRDNYLRKAHEVNPDAKIAVELTQAQLQIHHQQLEQALATLRHIQELAPHHNYVLKLLQTLYIELKDWPNLVALLPEIRRAKILSQENYEQLELMAYKNYLNKCLDKDEKEIAEVWNTIPKDLKYNTEIIAIYCNYLINTSKGEEAEKLIRETLKKQWDSTLVRLYCKIPNVDRKKQLITSENWLKNHNKDPDLLLCCGCFAMSTQLWGKARSYFEASIGIKPSKAAYTELAQLYEHLNEISMALDCYRKAIRVE